MNKKKLKVKRTFLNKHDYDKTKNKNKKQPILPKKKKGFLNDESHFGYLNKNLNKWLNFTNMLESNVNEEKENDENKEIEEKREEELDTEINELLE